MHTCTHTSYKRFKEAMTELKGSQQFLLVAKA